MVRAIKIPGYKQLTKNKELIKFNKPEYVYIPLIVGNDPNFIETVKKNEYVFKNQIIANRKLDNFPIHSSVSGTVIDFKEMYTLKGKTKCIVIKNDFKEQLKINFKGKEKLNSYTKNEFIELLKNCGIRGLGGADFTTYIKYQSDNLNILIVNAVECEPYITSDYYTLKKYSSEILEGIDAILEINKLKKCIIAIEKGNKELIHEINKHIGTYPNIILKEVKNRYPMGWQKILIEELTGLSYNTRTSEIGVVVNNVSTIYSIYKALKYNIPVSERVITFTGTMLKNPSNVLVKVGTKISDILDKLEIATKDYILITGGPMMGNEINSSYLVSTVNLNCIIVLPKKELDLETQCLRCSKCSINCPTKLTPVLIKDNINNLNNLKKLNVDKCVECGICSYVCPAKINLREYVREAKQKMREMK